MNYRSALAYSRLKQMKSDRLDYDKENKKVERLLGYRPNVPFKKQFSAIDYLMEIHKIL